MINKNYIFKNITHLDNPPPLLYVDSLNKDKNRLCFILKFPAFAFLAIKGVSIINLNNVPLFPNSSFSNILNPKLNSPRIFFKFFYIKKKKTNFKILIKLKF